MLIDMDFHLSTRLIIEKFKPSIKVGQQELEVDVVVFFPKTPLICISDEEKNSLLDSKCLEILEKETNKKIFNTIEHLAYTIHSALKKELPMTLEVMVKVRKLGGLASISFNYFPKGSEETKKSSLIWNEKD